MKAYETLIKFLGKAMRAVGRPFQRSFLQSTALTCFSSGAFATAYFWLFDPEHKERNRRPVYNDQFDHYYIRVVLFTGLAVPTS